MISSFTITFEDGIIYISCTFCDGKFCSRVPIVVHVLTSFFTHCWFAVRKGISPKKSPATLIFSGSLRDFYWGNPSDQDVHRMPSYSSPPRDVKFSVWVSRPDVKVLVLNLSFSKVSITRLTLGAVISRRLLRYLFVSGLEHEFQQKLLPNGRISIDGFICVFDVSDVAQRPMSKQVEHVSLILAQLAKTKKPIVLATTKNDELVRTHAVEAEHLLSRKELRGAGPILIVETSAHLNVNVEHAFMTLALLIERSSSGITGKLRHRPVTYSEALRARQELLEAVTAAYNSLVSSQVFALCCIFCYLVHHCYDTIDRRGYGP